MPAFLTIISVLVVVIVASLDVVNAHFNLINPTPYNIIDCRRPACALPCPHVWGSGEGKAQNTPLNAPIWKRGGKYPIQWHRNNHNRGFYRRALVPLKYMYSFEWHKKTAFEWGCHDRGTFQCKHPPRKPGDKLFHLRGCGTDSDLLAYSSDVIVPSVFPDGLYVFAQSWFGGWRFGHNPPIFPDYYTCAFIRIQGGTQLISEYTPKFTASGKHTRRGCISYHWGLGQCGGYPCPKAIAKWRLPKDFWQGEPPKMKLDDLEERDEEPEWVEEESERDDPDDIGKDEHVSCYAARMACKMNGKDLKAKMCHLCYNMKCAPHRCKGWHCKAFRSECEWLAKRSSVPDYYTEQWLGCQALNHACTFGVKKDWLRRRVCYLCMSKYGCGGLQCKKTWFCSGMVAECRAQEF